MLGRDSGSAGVSWSVWEVSWKVVEVSTEQTNPKIPVYIHELQLRLFWTRLGDICRLLLFLPGKPPGGFFFSKNRIPRSPTVCFENLFLTPPEGQLSCVHVVNLGSKKNTENTQLLPRVGAAVFFKKKCVLATSQVE